MSLKSLQIKDLGLFSLSKKVVQLSINRIIRNPLMKVCGPEACAEYYREKFKKMIIGTGDASLALSFYKKYGFQETYVVKNFFIDHYDHDIIENGCKLKDMQYLEKEI